MITYKVSLVEKRTKLQLQNLVPIWALETKLVPKAHVGTSVVYCDMTEQNHIAMSHHRLTVTMSHQVIMMDRDIVALVG